MAPEVCMVRTAAARKIGLSAKRVKEPFLWFQLVDFASFMVIITKAIVTLSSPRWLFSHLVLGVAIVTLVVLNGGI